MSDADWARFYTKRLGIVPPWRVTDFRPVGDDGSEVVVTVTTERGIELPCPRCGRMCKIHDRPVRRWRDLDVGGEPCYVEAEVPRTDCPDCGVLRAEVPWARTQVSYTRRFERKALSLIMRSTVSDTARELKVSREILDGIVSNRVRELIDGMDLSSVRAIHVDETSARKGHRYITIVSDAVSKRIIFMTEGRGSDTLGLFAEWLAAHGGDPLRIETVNCDMSGAYLGGIAENLPNARVVLDRFHVVKLAQDVLDAIRAKEQSNGSRHKWIRFTLLKNRSNMSEDDLRKLFEIEKDNKVLGLAFEMKEAFIQLYDYPDARSAGIHLSVWYDWVMEQGHPRMQRLAKTVNQRLDGILAWFTHHTSNAFQEGLNSMIQVSKRMARGYANISNLIDMIYLRHGNLA